MLNGVHVKEKQEGEHLYEKMMTAAMILKDAYSLEGKL